jgi:DNA polymerase III alpha subunit
MRIKTGYSFKVGIGHIDDVIKRLQEIGWTTAPISDRMSTFGFNRWTKAAKKANLRPIYGVELACAPLMNHDIKKMQLDHWTFFAKTSLRSLHDLIWVATDNTGNGEPYLTYAKALLPTDIIKIAGHRVQLAHLDPATPDLYIALSGALPTGLYKQAIRAGFQFIASGDNVYPRASDRETYRVTLGKRADVQTFPQHILSDDEWRASVEWFTTPEIRAQALANRERAMAQCNASMRRGTLLKPSPGKTLRQLCEEGAARLKLDLTNPIYAARLERELKLIEDKRFEDYFFILADMVSEAKKMMIVGPARGSSCGSLVCYLLNITTIDPIPFNLLFERFVDVNRKDLPDIDIDFSEERRDQIFKYAEEKYGIKHVARLGTVGVFRARTALQQAGAALRIPKWEIDAVLATVIERSGGDARALQTLEDTLNDTETGRKFLAQYPEAKIMVPMEGHPNISSQHAAGMIITQEPVMEYVAVDHRTKAAMCDKKDSEDLNLLKIDALGLTQLSVFERCLEMINVPSRNGWLEQLPLNDPQAFDVLNKGHFAGVFQFNGAVLQSVTSQIARSNAPVNHINDIVQITAVSRPGPAASGGTLAWIRRRTALDPIKTWHPMLTELTRETYGVILFQEQVMRVVRELGSLSWEDTSSIRKAMSGRLGDEYFEKFWQKFLAGALNNGIEETTARMIWEEVNTMGSWSFNQSHAVAYGMMSYYCCYLKAHYPMEFAAATLDLEKDPAKQIALLRELASEGIGYKAVDAALSTDHWAIDRANNRLVGPLSAIHGIGPAIVKEIIQTRAAGQGIRPVIQLKLDNPVTPIDSIYPIRDAIAKACPSLSTICLTTPTRMADVQMGAQGEIVVLGLADRIDLFDVNERIRVQRRGGKVLGPPTQAINLFMRDDSDQLLCRIDRWDYETIGRPVIEYGKPGKALYMLKGVVPENFRMLMVRRIRLLGDLEDNVIKQRRAAQAAA